MNNGYYSPDGNPQQTMPKRRSVLPVLSLLAGIFGLFAPVANSVCAIVLALAEKKESGMLDGKARSGYILGIIGIIFRLMLIAAAIAILIAFPELPENFGKMFDEALEHARAFQ